MIGHSNAMDRVGRAVVLESIEKGARLREVKTPRVGPGQVLIRVHTVSLNAFDWKVVAGVLKDVFPYRFPVTIGRDYAGVVVDVGEGVTRVEPGDPVFGYINSPELHRGSLVDYLCCDEDECFVPKPDDLTFERAACLPLAGVVAYRCVDAIAPQPGDRVLVLGAPGGVGSFAVQLLVAAGAHVIAACPVCDERYIRGLGVTETFNPVDGVVDVMRQRHPDGIQGLVDLVSYKPVFAQHADLLTQGGRAASTHRSVDVAVFEERGLVGTNVTSAPDRELLERIGADATRGEVAVPIQQRHTFDEAVSALERLRYEHTRGKAVVYIAGAVGR